MTPLHPGRSPEAARLPGLRPLDAVADAADGLKVLLAEGGVVERKQRRALERGQPRAQQRVCSRERPRLRWEDRGGRGGEECDKRLHCKALQSGIPCVAVTAKQPQRIETSDHQAPLCNPKLSNPKPTVSPTCWVRAPVKAECDAGRPGIIRVLSAVSIGGGGGKAKDQDKQALAHAPWKALL